MLFLGGIVCLLTVALGAFGAHALRDRIPAERLTVYQTGVLYQMFHGLALLATGLMMHVHPGLLLLTWAGWLFVVGILLFSGSLYALAMSGIRKLGAITPFGGVAFLAGWVCICVAVVRL